MSHGITVVAGVRSFGRRMQVNGPFGCLRHFSWSHCNEATICKLAGLWRRDWWRLFDGVLLVKPGRRRPLRGEIPAFRQGPETQGQFKRRYFVNQDGKPFFYLGDTCWLLFQRLNHDEVDEYLKDRAAKGFTVIQAYVIRGLDKRHPDGNSSLLGESPFIDRDPTKPNEAFFKNVDYVINRANELGLVMGLVTAKSWHVADHPEKVFDEKNAYVFGKFLGEHYKNNSVMWFPGGDSAPGKYEAVWVAMAKGIKDGSGDSQLVCYHSQGSTSSSTWFHKADWLDFNSIQSGHHFGSDSFAFVSKDYALTPAKPTVDMEPAYENHPTGANKPHIDSHKVRSQAYSAKLAGAAGHGYGALDLFWLYKDGDGPFPKNGFEHWRKAMAYEGSTQVGFVRRLFELRPGTSSCPLNPSWPRTKTKDRTESWRPGPRTAASSSRICPRESRLASRWTSCPGSPSRRGGTIPGKGNGGRSASIRTPGRANSSLLPKGRRAIGSWSSTTRRRATLLNNPSDAAPNHPLDVT